MMGRLCAITVYFVALTICFCSVLVLCCTGAEDIRSALRNMSKKQMDIQKQRKDHEDLVSFLFTRLDIFFSPDSLTVLIQVKSSKDYAGWFDLLAFHNQCFDKPDGQYTYTVCFGKDIKQRDTGGSSSTLLG